MTKYKISDISAYTIFDSRGIPTIEAEVMLASGARGVGRVPAGASKGSREAREIRDKDPNQFGGKSVLKAIHNIHDIIKPALLGFDVRNQVHLDSILIDLDGTADKSKLGANATLAVSMACCHAAAVVQEEPLFRYLRGSDLPIIPLPEIQIFGGGAHSAGRVDIQDFMIIAIGAKTLMESYQMTFDVYQSAGHLLADAGKLMGLADEGGYWPAFESNDQGLTYLSKAIEKAGYTLGTDVSISLDIAASDFYSDGKYHFALEDQIYDHVEFAKVINEICSDFKVCSIEDPFNEDDYGNWQRLTENWSSKMQIVGDDLFTTNPQYIRKGINQNWANAVLIKLNQIGTVTETLTAINLTKSAGWRPIISARSGETEDSFISHLAVATGAGQLKVGSFARSERMAKWNELIRIERWLGDEAVFAGSALEFPWS